MVLSDPNAVRQRVRESARISEAEGLSHLTFHAMGTQCRVLLEEPSRASANAYLDRLLNWIADFESRFSRFIDTSVVGRINASAGTGWVEMDAEADRLFSLCTHLHFLTRGILDASALPLLRVWNWKASPPVLPSAEAVEAARALVGWNKVERRPGGVALPLKGMGIDLGGVGKEYAVDMAVEMSQQHGIKNILVDFGQDLRVKGAPPGKPAWHIGLEDPFNPGRCWGSVALNDGAVASSGDYLRGFTVEGRRYGHILDPRTGWPVDNGCRAAVAIAPSCTMAGALTTAAFVLGVPEGIRLIESQFGASGALITETQRFHTQRFHEHAVQM